MTGDSREIGKNAGAKWDFCRFASDFSTKLAY